MARNGHQSFPMCRAEEGRGVRAVVGARWQLGCRPIMLGVMSHTFESGESSAPQLSPASRLARNVGRIALGAFLVFAGTGHLTFARESFQGQVPEWIPLDKDFVVVASGFVEVALGAALIFAWKWRVAVGWVVAAFFVAVFPGNISQLVTHNDSFGLDTDLKRWLRLPLQPVLIFWALWSTGAWRAWRSRRS